MRALAGPAMLLVIVGGFTIYKAMSKEDAPSRDFTELELAADDDDHTGTCYSLSTVLIANGVFGNALRTWTAPDPDNENKWTLEVENVRQGANGPEHDVPEIHVREVWRAGAARGRGRVRRPAYRHHREHRPDARGASRTASPRRSIAASRMAAPAINTRRRRNRSTRTRGCGMLRAHASTHIGAHRRSRSSPRRACCAAGHSAVGRRRAGIRSAARRARAAQGLVVQEHPQSFAHGVPAARPARPMARRSSSPRAADIASWCSIPRAWSPRSIWPASGSPRSR